MSITFVQGDIQLTRAQVIGVGYNARARHEEAPLYTRLAQGYPAAFAAFRKQAAAGRISAGEWWLWRDASPWLALLVVRRSNAGATRLRHVEQIALNIARDWPQQEGIHTAALTGLGDADEWPLMKDILRYWLGSAGLEVVVYEAHLPGQRAPEPWDAAGHP